MNYKKANSVSTVLAISGVISSVFLYCFTETNFWFYMVAAIAMLLIAAGLVIKVIFYRCPHCQRLLPFRTMFLPDYCPNCGEKLEP